MCQAVGRVVQVVEASAEMKHHESKEARMVLDELYQTNREVSPPIRPAYREYRCYLEQDEIESSQPSTLVHQGVIVDHP